MPFHDEIEFIFRRNVDSEIPGSGTSYLRGARLPAGSIDFLGDAIDALYPGGREVIETDPLTGEPVLDPQTGQPIVTQLSKDHYVMTQIRRFLKNKEEIYRKQLLARPAFDQASAASQDLEQQIDVYGDEA